MVPAGQRLGEDVAGIFSRVLSGSVPPPPDAPREPTTDQCSDHAPVQLANGRTGYACWYPQMGGYVGKAVAVPDGGCVDVWVWHDGQFPFRDERDSDDDDEWAVRRNPVELHHCDGEQFIRFGEFLVSLESGEGGE